MTVSVLLTEHVSTSTVGHPVKMLVVKTQSVKPETMVQSVPVLLDMLVIL